MAAFKRIVGGMRQFVRDSNEIGPLMQRCVVFVRFSDLDNGDRVGMLSNDGWLRLVVIDSRQRIVNPLEWPDIEWPLQCQNKLLAVGQKGVFTDPGRRHGVTMHAPVSSIELNGRILTFQDTVRIAAGK